MSDNDLVTALLELHKPIQDAIRSHIIYCQECNSLCHSTEGIMCDSPMDGMYPCDTVKTILRCRPDMEIVVKNGA